jgi:hypothetical protein
MGSDGIVITAAALEIAASLVYLTHVALEKNH